ncbi:DUF2254 family protein [Qipengyuania sphaerica]|uniref:DUF2254 family protein n=1 Tax=Qipengyuania sphaerica TaxID=2867243 RepID=UPI001C887A77|nr:DUF2254 family protein [Qipengyuania sphaerica]MBX7539843.1 DUF2254 domain-containing protein [Qipengyuania sphaerica]
MRALAATGPLKGIRDWVIHRLVANYWSLPAVAVLAAPLVGAAVLWADHAFASRLLLDWGVTPATTGDAAQDVTIAIVGINAAFLTLYWSVTLIVLTLATGNLGVRLVDRWLDKGLVRLSMAGLTFCLVFSVIVLMRIDAEASFEQLPHFTIVAMLALELVNIGMLGVAIHDLGRTMFVDRSIAHLGTDAGSVAIPVVTADPYDGEWGFTLPSKREGYIEGIDLAAIEQELAMDAGAVRFCAAPGQHVLEGEPLVRFQNAPPREDTIYKSIPIGEFRSSVQSTVYQVRLLVEVAARALSPGINDFYSAMACADQLAAAISGNADIWVDEGKVAAWKTAPRFELPGQDFLGLFDAPLKAFRQAAADYPSVSIRMIDNYARLCALMATQGCPPGLLRYLRKSAEELRDHALANAEQDIDRRDIAEAFARFDQPSPTLKSAA